MIGSEDEEFEYKIEDDTIYMTNEGDCAQGTIKNNEIQIKNWKTELLIFDRTD